MMAACERARLAFPNGLRQPRGGYRFSLDPLLLAAFVRPKRHARTVDLGAGCGVASFASLIRHQHMAVCCALDLDESMVHASEHNARLLGFEERFRPVVMDVRRVRELMPPECFGLALANPPYRVPGTGQPCQDEARNCARFETQGGLADFLAAAFWLLANRGALGVVYPAARLGELMAACTAMRLTPKRLRMVHSRLSEPARLVLLEAVKNAGPDMTVEPPLELYVGTGEDTRLTAQALEFCPALGVGREG